MVNTKQLCNSEWKSVSTAWPREGAKVTYVYRRSCKGGAREWEPWVVIAKSAIMASNGVDGLGLYAARGFKRDSYVGRYDGEIVGHYCDVNAAMRDTRVIDRVQRGHDRLIYLTAPGGGVNVMDGQNGGPPHIDYVNDPRGTRLRANACISPYGWLKVISSGVPPFRLDKHLHENINSELRYDYGDDYWQEKQGC